KEPEAWGSESGGGVELVLSELHAPVDPHHRAGGELHPDVLAEQRLARNHQMIDVARAGRGLALGGEARAAPPVGATGLVRAVAQLLAALEGEHRAAVGDD